MRILIKKISKRFRTLMSLMIVVLITSTLQAQDPNWSVNTSDYEYSMTVLAFLSVDGERLANENDKVGVFVNGICRGTTNLTYVESQDAYFAYLSAYSNTAGETISVQIYNATTDEIRSVAETFQFEISAQKGTLFQAVSWADPALSAEAEILAFEFENVTALDQIVEGRNILITVDNTVDISALTAIYSLSAGASLFINTAPQTSGVSQVDFTNPVTYQVRSQDQTIINEWTVSVQQLSSDYIFRKKDAVCFEQGAIKINSQENGTTASLKLGNTTIATQNFIANEVVFTGLDAGDYQVQIGNIIKAITINFRTN